MRAFHEGLSAVGFVEGRNVAIEYRWVEGKFDRMAEFADDLVRRRVTVIVALGGSQSSRLPPRRRPAPFRSCFTPAADPVAAGLVASLNRPGGNLTGVTTLSARACAEAAGTAA